MHLPPVTATMTFDQAAQAVLTYLTEHVEMGFWSITRVENGRQTYLYLDENAYGLVQGGSHPWEASYCIHMAAGTAPTVAPVAQEVPAYAAAGVNAAVPIGAYAGAVITEPDGELFGAICGIDPHSKADDAPLLGAAPLLALLGQLLSMVLSADRDRERAAVRLLESELAAELDSLTGLYNRRAWDRMLREEERRFRRFGDPTVLVMVDLDLLKQVNDSLGHQAGDDYLCRAARALAGAVRPTDVVARVGGDEFAVLMRDCPEQAAAQRVQDIHRAQEAAGVAASVGWAPVTLDVGFTTALARADEAMYAEKGTRRTRR